MEIGLHGKQFGGKIPRARLGAQRKPLLI